MRRLSTILRSVRSRSRLGSNGNEIAAVAVGKCRAAISVLETQDITLQTQMRLAEEEARALLRMGDKSSAETALKKKELMMRESERLQRTKVSLLSQILLVETAETRATAVEALASGLHAHKSMSAKMFNEVQLEKLQDDLLEQACFEAEMSNVMSQSFDAVTSFDDETNAGLERALDDLQAEELSHTIGQAGVLSTNLADAIRDIMRTGPLASIISEKQEPLAKPDMNKDIEVQDLSEERNTANLILPFPDSPEIVADQFEPTADEGELSPDVSLINLLNTEFQSLNL